MKSKLFFRLAILVSSVLLTLMIGELVLRTFFPQRTLSELKKVQLACYQSSSYLAYEFRPNCRGGLSTGGVQSSIHINSLGFRGGEVEEKKSKRIFLVGDSYIFGYGVDENQTAASKLEQQLHVEVVNGGMWGIGPDSEYLLTSRVGLPLKPDIIIVSIFPENDLRDIAESVWKESDTGELSSLSNDKFVDQEGFLRRHAVSQRYYIPILRDSHVAALLIDGLERAYSVVITKLKISSQPAEGLGNDGGADRRCLFEDQCEGRWGSAKENAAKVIQWFKRLSTENNIPLIMLIVPSKGQVDGQEPVETIFHTMVKEEKIPFVDLTETFRTSPLSTDQLFLTDGHWSPLGNELAASGIAQFLKESGIHLN